MFSYAVVVELWYCFGINTYRSTCTIRISWKFSGLYTSDGGLVSSVSIATGYGLDGPGIESRWGARFSAPVQPGPGALPASCTMGTGSFPGVKSGRGVTLTSRLLLVPWSWKSRAIPLLPLWAVRPVQNLSACTSVNFFFSWLKLNIHFPQILIYFGFLVLRVSWLPTCFSAVAWGMSWENAL